jgi:hypothetical protein
MIPVLRKTLAVASLAVLSAAGPVSGAHAAPTLTAASVFSTNSEGNNWNGLIWNTLGTPQEAALSSPSAPPDRWNLYLRDPVGGGFVNSGNDSGTSISLMLAPGTHTYALYGESTGPMPADQHFVLNLYFGGSTGAPVQRRFNPPGAHQLEWRHHLHRHGRGLAVPGRCHRPVWPPGGGLEPSAPTCKPVWSRTHWPWRGWRRRPAAGLIFHSDRGSQYCSGEFQAILESLGHALIDEQKGELLGTTRQRRASGVG